MALPNGYTKLSYIASSGTQYIDTNFIPNQDTRVVAEVELKIDGNNYFLFGARQNSTNNSTASATFGFNAYQTTYRTHYYDGWTDFGTTISYDKKFIIDANKNVTTLNGEHTVTRTYTTFTSPCTMTIFAVNTAGAVGTYGTAKIYSFKIYDNEILVRDYVPCIDSSGIIGLYDIVNGIFYINSGTGTFTYEIATGHVDGCGTTIIDGTSYGIGDIGKCIVDGTHYNIEKGKVFVDGTAYDISFVLPPEIVDIWNNSKPYELDYYSDMVYANGYWVIVGQYFDGNNAYARIAYSTELDGNWTVKDLWNDSGPVSTLDCIEYANGYWVVGGQYWSNRVYYARIAYSTSLTGTWTITDLWSGNESNNAIIDLTYGNGYWVSCGTYGSNDNYDARIAYKNTTAPSGNWTTVDIWSDSDENTSDRLRTVKYVNSKWLVCGQSRSSDTTAKIAYATTPSGTWTTKSLWTERYAFAYDITYANGYWVISGIYNTVSRISYSTSLTGTWTNKSLWTSDTEYCNSANYIEYINGYWVVGGQYDDGTNTNAIISYSTSLTGTWTNVNLWNSNNYIDAIHCVLYEDGYWVACGKCGLTDNPRICYCKDIEKFGLIEDE